ncbi:methycitrate-responsive transcriptional regulator of methylisocitrate utilization PrpR [Shewanella sp. NFH-SH190041]|uniref:GntR family transcriptional regulator n=1 Tax=Shewanella sp. NFH-SH190041 TaxID=2950245 RepID=UPI0021C29F9E|nr:GntR family transcriptional regulator [Shewanella sp. NFH-SH190041]BDM65993.1 methycitrate-responsive transcriptional regulator of methylisocitrate utilization PrpR [Shewanella sp. NFH-SH190041]
MRSNGTDNHSVTIKSGRLVDQVLAELQRRIIHGELAPGSKINEQDIAGDFGISRGPAREALQALERQRLVVRAPHIGARVASLSISELNELYQLRSVLESMACELAASRITPAQLDKLNTLIAAQQTALTAEDSDFQQQRDVDFHYQIIQASGNRHLQETLMGGLYHLLRMYRYQTSNRQRPVQAIAEHRAIVDAIADRDGELAALLMRRHIEQGRINTEQTLKTMQQADAGLPPIE